MVCCKFWWNSKYFGFPAGRKTCSIHYWNERRHLKHGECANCCWCSQVDQAIRIVCSAIANQVDWDDLKGLVHTAQAKGDRVAILIKSLKLETNSMIMALRCVYVALSLWIEIGDCTKKVHVCDNNNIFWRWQGLAFAIGWKTFALHAFLRIFVFFGSCAKFKAPETRVTFRILYTTAFHAFTLKNPSGTFSANLIMTTATQTLWRTRMTTNRRRNRHRNPTKSRSICRWPLTRTHNATITRNGRLWKRSSVLQTLQQRFVSLAFCAQKFTESCVAICVRATAPEIVHSFP